MNYYRAIKTVYSGIKDEEFKLQDDGDGVYIGKWTYALAPEPSLEDLRDQAIALEQEAEAKRVENSKYPAPTLALKALLKQFDFLEKSGKVVFVPELQEIMDKLRS